MLRRALPRCHPRSVLRKAQPPRPSGSSESRYYSHTKQRFLDVSPTKRLAAPNAYERIRSDASVSLSRPDFLKWVEKGLKIDLAADVTLEDLGKALGVWSSDDHERLQQLQREREQRER